MANEMLTVRYENERRAQEEAKKKAEQEAKRRR